MMILSIMSLATKKEESTGQSTSRREGQFLLSKAPWEEAKDIVVLWWAYISREEALLWRAITSTLLNKITLFKILVNFLKMNYNFILFLNFIINRVLTMMSLFSDALSVHL